MLLYHRMGNNAITFIMCDADYANAPYATINAYFELLPDQEEGLFDGDVPLSRAQAMTLIMRATTQVNKAQAPETDSDFTAKVGETQYTNFAAPMDEYAYVNTSTGLNEETFTSAMSRGEYIYLLANYYSQDYQAYMDNNGFKNNTYLVAAIAVMLVAALVVGGTLAYFTDKDNATNTFTVGNVKIDLLESSLHRENAGYVGTPGEELNPKNAELWSEVLKLGSGNTNKYKAGDTFYTDAQIEANAATYTCDGVELAPGQSYHKMPYVKNTGANDAYIRIRVMFPAELDTAVLNSSMYTTSAISRGEFTMVKTENVEKDGKLYNVYTFTRTEALKPNEMTYWNVWGTVHMDSDVTNEEIANLLPNGAFNVLVEADAIQADGFANATAAFAAFDK